MQEAKDTKQASTQLGKTVNETKQESGAEENDNVIVVQKKQGNSIEKPQIKGNFLVVSTVPEYGTCVYPMTQKLFKSGIEEVKYLLRIVAYFNQVQGYEFQ